MDKNTTFIFFSLFWVIVALVGCLVARFYNERALIRSCFLLTSFCCWLTWLTTYLMQLNPLIGPQANRNTILGMIVYWGDGSRIHNGADK